MWSIVLYYDNKIVHDYCCDCMHITISALYVVMVRKVSIAVSDIALVDKFNLLFQLDLTHQNETCIWQVATAHQVVMTLCGLGITISEIYMYCPNIANRLYCFLGKSLWKTDYYLMNLKRALCTSPTFSFAIALLAQLMFLIGYITSCYIKLSP